MNSDYSILTNAELSQLLTDNKIKGRSSATTKAQKIKLLNDFFGVKEPVSRTTPAPLTESEEELLNTPLVRKKKTPKNPSPKKSSPKKSSPPKNPSSPKKQTPPKKSSPSPKKSSPSPKKPMGKLKPINDVVITKELIENIDPKDGIIYLIRLYYNGAYPDKNAKKAIDVVLGKDYNKQREIIQKILKDYIGKTIHEKSNKTLFFTPQPYKFTSSDIASESHLYGKLLGHTLEQLKAVLTQFEIPRDIESTLNDKLSIVKFIESILIQTFPKSTQGGPSINYNRRQITKYIAPAPGETVCIDDEMEKTIENIIEKLSNPKTTKDEEEILIKQIKKLSVKIHPDKTGDKPYQKRCEELFKILSNYLV